MAAYICCRYFSTSPIDARIAIVHHGWLGARNYMSAADSHDDAPETVVIGRHEIAYAAHDFMVVRIHGSISADDARAVALAERKIWPNNDLIYLMVVVDENTSIESGMLADVKTIYAGRPPHISVLIGASFTIRTIGSVINRALRVFGRPSTLHFFEQEIAGRTWIEEDRKRRANE